MEITKYILDHWFEACMILFVASLAVAEIVNAFRRKK